MRCRTSGSSAKRTISWISFLPPSSAGCDLPAMTSCTGRSGCSSSRLSRSGSRSISVSRLYDGTRRAKPMVSTSASSAVSIHFELGRGRAALLPRLAAPARGRRRRAAGAAAAWCPRSPCRGPCRPRRRPGRGWSASGSGPGRAPWAAGEVEDLAGHPGRGVHAVGDRGDRPLLGVELRPQPAEHAAADHAVQLRDAVGALREPEAHHRHVEHGRVAALVVLRAERQDPLDRDAGAGVLAAEVLRDQVPREPVDAGRHRGVGGEHRAGAGDLEGRLEGQARCPR